VESAAVATKSVALRRARLQDFRFCELFITRPPLNFPSREHAIWNSVRAVRCRSDAPSRNFRAGAVGGLQCGRHDPVLANIVTATTPPTVCLRPRHEEAANTGPFEHHLPAGEFLFGQEIAPTRFFASDDPDPHGHKNGGLAARRPPLGLDVAVPGTRGRSR
jgi:hypothetical protein